MTNHWIDLQNCKAILVEGSNVAENHPMAYKWIRKAQENGAKIIHVDPRFTRTSAAAAVYARLRPGTDAAFQNTMINHIIVNKLYDEDYVVTHTNALFLGDAAFEFKDGLFSGYDEEHHKYDTASWGYELDAKGKPRLAKSLDDPHCVFARLKKFVSRYTLDVGERITGVPAAKIREIADPAFKSRTLPMLFKADGGADALRAGVVELCRQASQAIREGCKILSAASRSSEDDENIIIASCPGY